MMSAILFLTFLFHLDLKVRVRRRVCWIIYFFYFTLELLNGYYFFTGLGGWVGIHKFGNHWNSDFQFVLLLLSLLYIFPLSYIFFLWDCFRS